MKPLRTVSVHSFLMFGVSTRGGTYFSLGRWLGRWLLSSVHLWRALWRSPPTEFVPEADQSPQVANRPPQVINVDSTAVSASSDGAADEDDEVMEVDNPTGVLSSD